TTKIVVLVEAAEIAHLEINPSSMTLATTQKFTATAFYSNGSKVDISELASWSIDEEHVARLNSSQGAGGFVDSLSRGTFTLSVSYQGKVTSRPITVNVMKVVGLDLTPADGGSGLINL